MAITVAEYRMYALAWMGGSGPPSVTLGLTGDAESESEVPGSVLVDDGAGWYESNNADPAIVVGILERATPTAVAAGDLYPVTLILPNFFYEMSVDAGAPVRGDLNVLGSLLGSNAAASGGFAELNFDTAGNAIVRPVAFASDFDKYVTGAFIGKNDPSATAGSLNVPNAYKGVSGDTTPRLIATFTTASCLWVG